MKPNDSAAWNLFASLMDTQALLDRRELDIPVRDNEQRDWIVMPASDNNYQWMRYRGFTHIIEDVIAYD